MLAGVCDFAGIAAARVREEARLKRWVQVKDRAMRKSMGMRLQYIYKKLRETPRVTVCSDVILVTVSLARCKYISVDA